VRPRGRPERGEEGGERVSWAPACAWRVAAAAKGPARRRRQGPRAEPACWAPEVYREGQESSALPVPRSRGARRGARWSPRVFREGGLSVRWPRCPADRRKISCRVRRFGANEDEGNWGSSPAAVPPAGRPRKGRGAILSPAGQLLGRVRARGSAPEPAATVGLCT
jgi:hypothetical protein